MDAWEELPPHEYDRSWAMFTATFRFRPSIHPTDWPGIVEPLHSTTYDVSEAYDDDDPWLRPVKRELNVHFLRILKKIVPMGGFIYAMDWHQGWRLYPHRDFDAKDPGAWGVSPLPHGDYTVFLTSDLHYGTFGHPWEGTICAFGQELTRRFRADQPKLFNRILRQDGSPVHGAMP